MIRRKCQFRDQRSEYSYFYRFFRRCLYDDLSYIRSSVFYTSYEISLRETIYWDETYTRCKGETSSTGIRNTRAISWYKSESLWGIEKCRILILISYECDTIFFIRLYTRKVSRSLSFTSWLFSVQNRISGSSNTRTCGLIVESKYR